MAAETTTGSDFVAHPICVQQARAPIKYKAPEGTMDTTSVYKREYQGIWGERADLCKLPAKINEGKEAMESATTHSRDYNRKQLSSARVNRTPIQYRPPNERFNSVTTAQDNFVDHGRVATHSFKPQEVWLKTDEPFINTTSYRSTFTPLPLPERKIQSSPEYIPPRRAFEATSTSKSDYCEKPVTPRAGCVVRPDNKVFDDSVPFQNVTTNRRSYQRWAIPVKYNRTPEKYSPSSAKLSSETTMKKDFQRYEDIKPPVSFKPSHNIYEQAQFEGTTTKSADYKAWSNVKIPEPITHIRKYEPPAAKFDATSTFRAHYLGTTQPRTPSLKPPAKTATNAAKLESRTSYSMDYTFQKIKPCPAALLPDTNPGYKFSHKDNTTGHKYFKSAEASA